MDRDYVIERYQTSDSQVPFTAWIESMKRKDPFVITRIFMRINRAIKGNFGDYRYLRHGVWEMKIDSGPGYRIYFAVENRQILLLLIGGSKKTQQRDILQAIKFLQDYQSKEIKGEPNRT